MKEACGREENFWRQCRITAVWSTIMLKYSSVMAQPHNKISLGNWKTMVLNATSYR